MLPLQRYFRAAFGAQAAGASKPGQTFRYEGDTQVVPASTQKLSSSITQLVEGFSSGGGAEPEDKLKKFWLPITGVDGGPAGYIETSMELVPAEAARTQKAGFGRSEPNANPKLPNPTGRISLSLNPLKMLTTVVGPKVARRLCCGCCCCLCLLLFAHAAFQPLPVLLGDAISELLGTEPDAEVEVEVEGDNSTA